MSDGPDKHEKRFDPTPQRLKKAQEEGNVFHSQETTAVGMLATGASILVLGGPIAFGRLQDLMSYVFLSAASSTLNVATIPQIITDLGYRVAFLMVPFFLVLTVTAFGLNILQSGWNVTVKPLVPKGNRISPLQGLKRIFSARGLFGFLKSLLKLAIVGPLAYLTISGHFSEILVLHTRPLQDILGTTTHWIVVLLAQMIGVLIALSAADFAFEKWKYKEDLKMTKKEIEDEHKEQEGDPHLKGKRQERARERARQPRLDHAVMKSDVVVTNPTHYAVALRYDPSEAEAPQVLAKGIRKRALRIKALAQEHEVPTVEDRPLARALYASVEAMQEIPEDLYPAVAAILAEIYRKQNRSF